MDELNKLILDHSTALKDYFGQTDTLVVIVLDKELNIAFHNACFKHLISSEKDCFGEHIHSFMLPESCQHLPLTESTTGLWIWLNFKAQDSSPLPLHCYVVTLDDGNHLILGGHLMLTNDKILQQMTIMSNEMANMTRDLHRKNRELQEAHANIKILSGIIPICMHCKEIRDDKGYWNKLEKFITENSEAQFSHGLCEQCLKKHYPDI